MGGVRAPARGGAGVEPGALVADRYRVIRKLGEGGTSEIWLAEHEHLRMEVAVKVLKPALLGNATIVGEALERFRFEAQVAAKLGQKTGHVVPVYDAGRGEHGPYLAMELVRGRSLREALQQRGVMAAEAFAPVLEAITDALSPAHAAGIVHRNLKPSNVLLADEPYGGCVVKVADFGVPRGPGHDALRDVPTRDAAEVISAPEHMSPEQLRGEPLDERADIWALGVLAYEALTGKAPFATASVQELLVKVMLEPFAPPSHVCPEVPRALDAWFARALAKQAAERFASAKELCEAYLAALGLSSSLPPRSGRGSMASIPDPHSRPTFPILTGPGSVRRPTAPALDPGGTTDAVQAGVRPRRAAAWGLAAVAIAVVATAGAAGLAAVAIGRAQEAPALLREAFPAGGPAVTPGGPAGAGPIGEAAPPGAEAAAAPPAGGNVAARAGGPPAGSAASRPPAAPAGKRRPRKPGQSDPSSTF